MEEVKKGSNSSFKPRPKPTLEEVKQSGVRQVIGVAPRPKPDFSKKPIPPRPKPPVRPKQEKVEPKNEEVKGNQQDAMQAYNNMLNNMQLMNAIGLVNGIYQNAQQMNNRQYDNKPTNFDKQTLFDEFYEYLTNKMQKDGKFNLDSVNNSINETSGSDDENFVHTAAINAKKRGLSLEQYLEQMCSEDEFIKFSLQPLKVENLSSSKAIVSPVPFVRAYDYGNVLEVGEYTYDDYQNLINQNYSVYIEPLKNDEQDIAIVVPDVQKTPVQKVDNSKEIKEENLEEVPEELDVNASDFSISDDEQYSSIVADEVASNVEEKQEDTDIFADGEEEVAVNLAPEDETNILQDFYSDEAKENQVNADEKLNELIDDIAGDNRKREITEDYEKIAEAEKNKIIKPSKSFIEFIESNDEQVENSASNKKENNNSQNSEKFNDFVFNTLHAEEIERDKAEKASKKLQNVKQDNEQLKEQVDELRNIVVSLKQEVSQSQEENQTLKQKYDVINTRNKEKDKAISQTNGSIAELERENRFMKDVVQSLLVEVQELKNSMARQERANKLKEKQAKPKYEIVAPVAPVEEKKEEIAVQEVKKPVIEEKIDKIDNFEQQQEQEEFNEENLTQVDNSVFDAETYNVDGIIVDEDASEISGHFVDKIHNAEDSIKSIYNDIRNELLSYKDVKGRCSSACDTFRLNGEIIAKFLLIGKTIKLYLALNPNDENLPQNIYHQKDESKKKAYKETPFMVRLASDLAVRKAIKLIEYMFDELDVVKDPKYEQVDYANTLERQTVKK